MKHKNGPLFIVMAYRTSTARLGMAAAPCRSAGGKICFYHTLEEAEAIAREYNARTVSVHVKYLAEEW